MASFLTRRGGAVSRAALLIFSIFSVAALPATAQEEGARRDTVERRPIEVAPLVVTATREPRASFELAAPVLALDASSIIRIAPNTTADLFRDLPGLDLSGVGPSQTRPIIRGQKGQRILLLEDGLRLNNTRRQQDFGELPALSDVSSLDRVEVMRGPASVLYGSDAIGGVVNMITNPTPPRAGGDVFNGRLQYEYRGAGSQQQPRADIAARVGKLGLTASGSYRDAEAYLAPAGTFGEVTLAKDALVNDTGVRDLNLAFRGSYDFDARHSLLAGVSVYDAEDAGFGFVSNDDLGTIGDPTVRILYPEQNVERFTLGYRGADLGTAVADRIDVKGFYSSNERLFDLDVFIPFSPQSPDAGIAIESSNFTDITTTGFRFEAAKLAGDIVLLTYGIDYFNDDSRNTDRSSTSLIGAGPPMPPEVSETPLVPNADYRSTGVFAQADFRFLERLSIIAGGRYQGISAGTRDTPNSVVPPTDYSADAFVAAANVLFSLTENVNLAANVGSGFRAPNLIELFFEGPTPEGAGFQRLNPDLEPETSLNVDFGLKFETSRLAGEAFYFRNEIRDGIRPVPTGETVGPFDEFQNVNIDEIRYHGVELAADVRPIDALTIGGSFSWLDAEDTLDPMNPIGESYATKFTSRVLYVHPSDRFWGEYRLRVSGESRDGQAISGPVGNVLPGFTVHDVRGGVRLLERGRTRTDALISVTNLTNELFAEASNASFFRPQPKRAVRVGLAVTF
jgi:hemoglobin/transferrin/lactoferrin receptor protein